MPIQLVLHGTYQTEDGYQARIVEELEPGDPETSIPAMQYEEGYRFVSDNGNTYTADGRFDIIQQTALDLIKPVPKYYRVICDDFRFSHLKWKGNASDPKEAIRRFQKQESLSDEKIREARITVYEMTDVTPR